MITAKQRKFLDSLTDKEYREMFADELVGTSLAFQIRRLREARQLTQNDISGLTGKAQPTISQWEDPNYGRYTLSTLKELAAAFKVALLVRFVSFSELADWTVDVDSTRLIPPSYDDEYQTSFADVSDSASWIGVLGYSPEHGPMNVDSRILGSSLGAAETFAGRLPSDFDWSAVQDVKPARVQAPQGVREFAIAA